MKTLVVYNSVHGNMEIMARTIGDAIPGEVERAAIWAKGLIGSQA